MDGNHNFNQLVAPPNDPSAPRYNDFRTWISALQKFKVTIDNLATRSEGISDLYLSNPPLSIIQSLRKIHLNIHSKLREVQRMFELIQRRIRSEQYQLDWEAFSGLIDATTAFDSIDLSNLGNEITEVELEMPRFVLPDVNNRVQIPPPHPNLQPSDGLANASPQMHGFNPSNPFPPIFGGNETLGFYANYGSTVLVNGGLGLYPNMGNQFIAGAGGLMGQPPNIYHSHGASGGQMRGLDIDQVHAFSSRLSTTVTASVDESVSQPGNEPRKLLPKEPFNMPMDALIKSSNSALAKPVLESPKANVHNSVNISIHNVVIVRVGKRPILGPDDADDEEGRPVNALNGKRARI